MFLTPEEVEELTGKVRPSAQIRALRFMGIVHRVRPDGRPIVLSQDVHKAERATAPAFKLNMAAIK